jgi:cysteinyl-tRNA synthetase
VSVYNRLYNTVYRNIPEPDRTKLSVASYNCGMDLRKFKTFGYARNHVPEETRDYVDRVIQFREKSVKLLRVED